MTVLTQQCCPTLHSFRSSRRHAAIQKREAVLLDLRLRLAEAEHELHSWQAWWNQRKSQNHDWHAWQHQWRDVEAWEACTEYWRKQEKTDSNTYCAVVSASGGGLIINRSDGSHMQDRDAFVQQQEQQQCSILQVCDWVDVVGKGACIGDVDACSDGRAPVVGDVGILEQNGSAGACIGDVGACNDDRAPVFGAVGTVEQDGSAGHEIDHEIVAQDCDESHIDGGLKVTATIKQVLSNAAIGTRTGDAGACSDGCAPVVGAVETLEQNGSAGPEIDHEIVVAHDCDELHLDGGLKVTATIKQVLSNIASGTRIGDVGACSDGCAPVVGAVGTLEQNGIAGPEVDDEIVAHTGDEPHIDGGLKVTATTKQVPSNAAIACSDPRAVLRNMPWPHSVEQWAALQSKIWCGHPQLPPGWIRCWNRVMDCVYYLRVSDMRTTFEIDNAVG